MRKKITLKKEPTIPLKKKMAPKPKSFTKAVFGIKFKASDDVVKVKVGEEEIRERWGKLARCLVGWW